MAQGQEESLLLDSVARFLDERCAPPIRRKLAAQALRRSVSDGGAGDTAVMLASLWRQVCELGWPLLLTSEARGGIDMGMTQAVQVVEAAGGALLPLPLAGWMTAYAFVQEVAPQSEVADWAQDCMRQGKRVVLGARASMGDRYFVPYCDSGECPDPQPETLILDHDGDVVEMRVAPAPAGSARIDPVVRCAWLRDPAPRLAASVPCAPAVWHAFRQRQRLLLVAELLGVAAGALRGVIAYVREREQFGRPIGAFQAIKHRLAQDWMNLDNVRLLVNDAAMALETGAREADAALSLTLAESLVQDAAGQATRNALQFHGALGMTWECDMHFYLKRALLLTAQMNQDSSQAQRQARIWQMTESNVTVVTAHPA